MSNEGNDDGGLERPSYHPCNENLEYRILNSEFRSKMMN